MPASFTVHLSGPLFQANASEAVHAAVSKGLLKVALQGQRLVQEQMVPGHGVKTGYARRSVGGFLQPGSWNEAVVRSNSPGEEPVIYMSFLEEGPHGRQHPGKFTGYGFFASAASKIEALDFNALLGSAIVAKLDGGLSNAAD